MPDNQNAAPKEGGKGPLQNLKLASDEPYVYVGDDLLGREDQVENLAHFITATPTPFTFAVYGQWGSGKTRFLKDVQVELKKKSTSEQPITTVWFDLWEHQSDADAAVAMIQCAMEELDPRWQKDRHLRQVLGQLISATSVGSNFSIDHSSVKAGVTISTSNWKEASKAVKEKELEVLDRQGEMKEKFRQVLDALVTPVPGIGWFLVPVLIILGLLIWAGVSLWIEFSTQISRAFSWLWTYVDPVWGTIWNILVPLRIELILIVVGLVVWMVVLVVRRRMGRNRGGPTFRAQRIRWYSLIAGKMAIAKKRERKKAEQDRNGTEDKRNESREDREDAQGRVVFFIDDLDRCLPEQALALLERIRLFLAVEGSSCIFVLGLDPDAIEPIVSSKYAQPSAETRAADQQKREDLFTEYLEKLIQFSIRLPIPAPKNLHNYVTSIINANFSLHVPCGYEDRDESPHLEGLQSSLDSATAKAIISDLAEAAEKCEASLRRTKRLVNAFTYYYGLTREITLRNEKSIANNGRGTTVNDYDVEIIAVVAALQVLYPQQWDAIHHPGGYQLLARLFNPDLPEFQSPTERSEALSSFSPPEELRKLAKKIGMRVEPAFRAILTHDQYIQYFDQYCTLVETVGPDLGPETKYGQYVFTRLIPSPEYEEKVARQREKDGAWSSLRNVIEHGRVGQIVEIKGGLWRILKYGDSGTKVLLLSDGILAHAQWHHEDIYIDWGQCDLHDRLQEYMETRFGVVYASDSDLDPSDQETHYWCSGQREWPIERGLYLMSAGSADLSERSAGEFFFLLSEDEAEGLGDQVSKPCQGIDEYGLTGSMPWWLRSWKGGGPTKVYVCDGRTSACRRTNVLGVRPAFWLSLSSQWELDGDDDK